MFKNTIRQFKLFLLVSCLRPLQVGGDLTLKVFKLNLINQQFIIKGNSDIKEAMDFKRR